MTRKGGRWAQRLLEATCAVESSGSWRCDRFVNRRHGALGVGDATADGAAHATPVCRPLWRPRRSGSACGGRRSPPP
eukprot:239264-Pleurochrysis_carterae.AAC.1